MIIFFILIVLCVTLIWINILRRARMRVDVSSCVRISLRGIFVLVLCFLRLVFCMML